MKCKLMFVLTIKIFWYNFVRDGLLTLKQMFKKISCVTVSFRNTAICSGNYVASYYRSIFG